jgi:hypothetical protein
MTPFLHLEQGILHIQFILRHENYAALPERQNTTKNSAQFWKY